MIVHPNAKINLGLNVLERRADGYHEIESILAPIPVHDVLEVVIAPELGPNGLVYTRSGLPIPGELGSDLCFKAIHLLQQGGPLPGLRMHLHKIIPMGAGLGGGSSDGAHALELVNELCALGLSRSTLAELALTLGSDCPFFLHHVACSVTGRGEVITPLDLDLGGLWLVLIAPGVHVSTSDAYRNTRPTGIRMGLAAKATRSRLSSWKHDLINTMTTHVVSVHPVVGQMIELLEKNGAVHASMSGSGSSVYGLFENEPGKIQVPDSCRLWVTRFQPSFPVGSQKGA